MGASITSGATTRPLTKEVLAHCLPDEVMRRNAPKMSTATRGHHVKRIRREHSEIHRIDVVSLIFPGKSRSAELSRHGNTNVGSGSCPIVAGDSSLGRHTLPAVIKSVLGTVGLDDRVTSQPSNEIDLELWWSS